MVFGLLEVLTKRILVPTVSKIWGSGQMQAGLVCLDIGQSVCDWRVSTQSSRSEGTSSSTYSPGQTTVAGEEARRM